MKVRDSIIFCYFSMHLLTARRSGEWTTIVTDLRRYREFAQFPPQLAFGLAMFAYPEFRAVVYYRLRQCHAVWRKIMKILAPPTCNLYIVADRIGPGMFIHHGFSTIINARAIGRDCYILQQVTIGWTEKGCPSLGDNVYVGCGAKILGPVHVGDNVKIGANAVVISDVPSNCTVAGVPARIVRKHIP